MKKSIIITLALLALSSSSTYGAPKKNTTTAIVQQKGGGSYLDLLAADAAEKAAQEEAQRLAAEKADQEETSADLQDNELDRLTSSIDSTRKNEPSIKKAYQIELLEYLSKTPPAMDLFFNNLKTELDSIINMAKKFNTDNVNETLDQKIQDYADYLPKDYTNTLTNSADDVKLKEINLKKIQDEIQQAKQEVVLDTLPQSVENNLISFQQKNYFTKAGNEAKKFQTMQNDFQEIKLPKNLNPSLETLYTQALNKVFQEKYADDIIKPIITEINIAKSTNNPVREQKFLENFSKEIKRLNNTDIQELQKNIPDMSEDLKTILADQQKWIKIKKDLKNSATFKQAKEDFLTREKAKIESIKAAKNLTATEKTDAITETRNHYANVIDTLIKSKTSAANITDLKSLKSDATHAGKGTIRTLLDKAHDWLRNFRRKPGGTIDVNISRQEYQRMSDAADVSLNPEIAESSIDNASDTSGRFTNSGQLNDAAGIKNNGSKGNSGTPSSVNRGIQVTGEQTGTGQSSHSGSKRRGDGIDDRGYGTDRSNGTDFKGEGGR